MKNMEYLCLLPFIQLLHTICDLILVLGIILRRYIDLIFIVCDGIENRIREEKNEVQ